jgi:hypothetical protein
MIASQRRRRRGLAKSRLTRPFRSARPVVAPAAPAHAKAAYARFSVVVPENLSARIRAMKENQHVIRRDARIPSAAWDPLSLTCSGRDGGLKSRTSFSSISSISSLIGSSSLFREGLYTHSLWRERKARDVRRRTQRYNDNSPVHDSPPPPSPSGLSERQAHEKISSEAHDAHGKRV